MSEPVKLMIVDDHHVVRQGLAFYFTKDKQFEVVAEGSNGLEALSFLEKGLEVDVILLDLSMPEMDGVEATKEIKHRYPHQKILILTSFGDQDNVISAVRAGADGYCLKDTEPEELISAIQKVFKGDKNIDPKVANHLFQHVNNEESEDSKAIQELTKREREVLVEIAKGKNNKEIAESLFVTEKTIKTHISNLFSKLPVSDRTQAALFAVKNKIAND
ncbi:DNA-binding response regulator [Halalkalibacillus sediminis]|uniref:DNA-binding response regulator n=1 Tax=Halalkalibacillus sediminis TaxID=2018042 RepID=A0A2I0QTB6_9BACI|nr:response regulator transcription factor [Halalkalibacillus sediminis]PKR77583.1 DNA-binding response regulator [Halalkalibacillus sediminis]